MDKDHKIQEILNVINDELDFADAKTKKSINERYNLSGSKKTKEIEHELLEIANNIRKEKINDFSENDYRVWNKYWNYPTSKVKIAEAMKGESEEWISYVLNIYKDLYKNTIGRVSEDKRYFRLLDYKEENSYQAKKNKERIQFIYEKLTLLTFAFKEKMYKRFINTELSRFNWMHKIDQELSDEEKKNIKKENPKLYSAYIQIKHHSDNFNWNTYKEYIDKEFENIFSNNIMAIAQRINNNKKVNINHLKLKSIEEDPKFFEIILRDCGNYLIHCRSIIAAEDSMIVQTHYRFIVTVKHI